MPASTRRALMNRRSLSALAGAGLAIVFAGSAAIGARIANVSAPPAAEKQIEFAAADLVTVRAVRLERGLPLTGTLSPLTEARVKAKVAGELVMLATREGEAVRRGQVLARIDPTEVQARLTARSADVEAARAQLVLAEKNRNTQKALLDRSFISRNAFDSTQSSYEVALAKLRASEAELAMAQKSRGDAVVLAPFDGVISERHARQGERVSIDAPILTVVDLSRLELEAPLPAAQIAAVQVGQAVELKVDGFGERVFAGRIERINPATTAGTRSINVYAVIDNRQGALRGGMFAHGQVVWEQIERALVIPATAVRDEGGTAVVYAIEQGAVRRKPITVGKADAQGQVQILAGLEDGTAIVRTNLGRLADGAPARISQPATGAK